LGEQALGRTFASDDRHRIDVEQKASGAAIVVRLGIKDVCLAKAEIIALESARVLVQ